MAITPPSLATPLSPQSTLHALVFISMGIRCLLLSEKATDSDKSAAHLKRD